MSQKRRDLTLSEKHKILRAYDALSTRSQREAALKLGISQPLLCKLLKNRTVCELGVLEDENLNRKRRRCGKSKFVEEALLRWFTKARLKNASISRRVLCKKAKEFANELGEIDFIPTDGWLSRWKERHNIGFKTSFLKDRVINNLGFSEITDDSEVAIIGLQVKNESEAQTEIHSCVSSELNIEQEDSMEENNRCSTSCDRVLNSPQEEVNSTDKTPNITIESVFSQACKTSEATSSSTIKCKQEPQNSPDHIDQFCSYLNSRLHRIDKRDCHEVMRATEMLLLEKEGQEKYLSEM